MRSHKRGSVQDRNIGAAILSRRIDEEVRMLTSEREWLSGKRDGITLVKYPHLRVVLVALRKGAKMREHKLKGPISLFVVQGRINVEAGSAAYTVKKKGLVTLRKAILHDVQADQDSVFLLTIAPPSA